MNAQHTPGPWKPSHCLDCGETEWPCTDADERLIAAAPELLEALWEISQRVAREGGDTAQADRAIAKATTP